MGKKFTSIPEILPRLNGIKYLIQGNHEGGFEDLRPGKKELFERLYLTSGIKKLYYGIVNFDREFGYDLNITLCHFPYIGTKDYYDDKHNKYKPENRGKLLLHGHTHQKQQITGPNQIHVGVDAWNLTPVHLDEILALERYMKIIGY